MKIGLSSKLNFKAHYTNVDIGANSLYGSLKIRTVDDKGKTVACENMSVFEKGEKRDEERFEKNVAFKIADYERRNRNKIAEIDKENKLALTVSYPAVAINTDDYKEGFVLSDFCYDDTGFFHFKTPVLAENINSYLLQNGVFFEKAKHVNNAVSAGACILSKIRKDKPEMLEEGKEIAYIYSDNKAYSGVIMVDDENIKIKPMDIQHIRKDGIKETYEFNTKTGEIVSNFSKAIFLEKEEKDKIKDKIKVVCDYDIAKNYIPKLTKYKYDAASLYAINQYIDSLARIATAQICALNTKDVVISGKTVNDLKEAVEKNSDSKNYNSSYETTIRKDKFLKILKNRIEDRLTMQQKQCIGEADKLNIKILQMDDNTNGAEILHKSKAIGKPPVWYNISK